MARKQRPLSPRTQIKRLKTAVSLQEGKVNQLRGLLKEAEQRLTQHEDKLLPQKQLILKELSEMVAAVSQAVRTTMWSVRERKDGGW